MRLTSAAQTDIGLHRLENEDRMLGADELGLYAVADGIGGLPGGAEAAQTAITTLLQAGREAAGRGASLDLSSAVVCAHRAVLELAARLTPHSALGTTLCAALVCDGTLHVANVGDSRCYLFRDDRLLLLTVDDSVEQEVLQRRARGEKVRFDERHRNAITRCLGQPMPLHVSVSRHSLQAGDQILVCTDGICRVIEDAVIAAYLGRGDDPAEALAALVAESLARGGPDNATGVLARVESM